MILRTLPAFLPRPLVPATLLLLVGGALAPSAASAQSSAVTAPTVITAVPYTISTSGKYILGSDLTNTSDTTPAITISVANVNLDLGGYFISGSGTTASTNDVIKVGDVAGVVIKNGTVANDGVGIEFTGTTDPRDYVVELVTFTHCYTYGVLIDADPAIAAVVRYCKFSNSGGTTAGQGNNPSAIFTCGGVRLEKNTIDTIAANTTDEEDSYGINAIENDFAIGNTIANCNIGISSSTFLNNLTTGVTTPFDGGDNATGNTSVEPGDDGVSARKTPAHTNSSKKHHLR